MIITTIIITAVQPWVRYDPKLYGTKLLIMKKYVKKTLMQISVVRSLTNDISLQSHMTVNHRNEESRVHWETLFYIIVATTHKLRPNITSVG